MSVKITKKRTIQAWIDETIRIINITLTGREIPIDITKLPPELHERIAIHTKKQQIHSTNSGISWANSIISPELRKKLDEISKD
jgi:hypothetical protein